MTTLELKSLLMHKIAGIEDKAFLNAIKTMIESKSESSIYKTTPEQKRRIKESREQIARGEFFTNEQVQKEVNKWLKEK